MSVDEDRLRRDLWRPPTEARPARPSLRVADHTRWILALVASLFLPGVGQLLNRSWWKALAVFVIWTAAWVTHLKPVWMVACLYAGIEAGLSSARRSRDRHAETVSA
jgi:hypothetical protein